ncbi:MAG TPA: TraR/DksA family transcriptional regulator [Ktedonobacterales bacterium]|nr:TraR/DksA family transcriptional regulator [Ktedonobacterales bacterium]
MSENSELTPAVLEELHTALHARQADLQRQIADLRQSQQGTVDQPEDATYNDPSDSGDASVDLQDREDTSDTLGALQGQLDEVEHALAKFAVGTYGVCERCGRPIPLARLRVLPEARYDVEYEEDVEAGRAPR